MPPSARLPLETQNARAYARGKRTTRGRLGDYRARLGRRGLRSCTGCAVGCTARTTSQGRCRSRIVTPCCTVAGLTTGAGHPPPPTAQTGEGGRDQRVLAWLATLQL